MESKENNDNIEDSEEIKDKVSDLKDEEILQEEDIVKDPNTIDSNIDMDIDDIAEQDPYQKEYPDFVTKGEIYSIAFHPSSSTLVIGDGDDTTTFFNINTKSVMKTQKINKDSVNFVSFSFDNKYLLTASVDGSIHIFSVPNFDLIQTIDDQDQEITFIEWHPKGPAFCFGSAEGAAWVYIIKGETNENFNFYLHNGEVTAGGFIKEGKEMITVGEDQTARIYELKSRTLKHTIKSRKYHKTPIVCIGIAKIRPIFATGSSESEFGLANYDTGNILYINNLSSNGIASIETIEFVNNDNYVTFGDSGSKVYVFDLNMFQVRSVITLENENIIKMTPSKLRPYEVYASGSNGNMYIFDTRGNGSIVQKDKAHSDVIMDFIVTENEKFVITSSLDKTINLVKIVNLN